jgi:hypothetical protein
VSYGALGREWKSPPPAVSGFSTPCQNGRSDQYRFQSPKSATRKLPLPLASFLQFAPTPRFAESDRLRNPQLSVQSFHMQVCGRSCRKLPGLSEPAQSPCDHQGHLPCLVLLARAKRPSRAPPREKCNNGSPPCQDIGCDAHRYAPPAGKPPKAPNSREKITRGIECDHLTGFAGGEESAIGGIKRSRLMRRATH